MSFTIKAHMIMTMHCLYLMNLLKLMKGLSLFVFLMQMMQSWYELLINIPFLRIFCWIDLEG